MGKQLPFEMASQWLSRTLAILILMVGPGLLGSVLDTRFGTSFLTPSGSLLGIALAMVALIVLTKKLAPPGRGNPLPPEEDSTGVDENSE